MDNEVKEYLRVRDKFYAGQSAAICKNMLSDGLIGVGVGAGLYVAACAGYGVAKAMKKKKRRAF